MSLAHPAALCHPTACPQVGNRAACAMPYDMLMLQGADAIELMQAATARRGVQG